MVVQVIYTLHSFKILIHDNEGRRTLKDKFKVIWDHLKNDAINYNLEHEINSKKWVGGNILIKYKIATKIKSYNTYS